MIPKMPNELSQLLGGRKGSASTFALIVLSKAMQLLFLHQLA